MFGWLRLTHVQIKNSKSDVFDQASDASSMEFSGKLSEHPTSSGPIPSGFELEGGTYMTSSANEPTEDVAGDLRTDQHARSTEAGGESGGSAGAAQNACTAEIPLLIEVAGESFPQTVRWPCPMREKELACCKNLDSSSIRLRSV